MIITRRIQEHVGVVQILFQLLSTFLVKWLSLRAARLLHNNMLAKLLRQVLCERIEAVFMFTGIYP